jgi:hypothetical protein
VAVDSKHKRASVSYLVTGCVNMSCSHTSYSDMPMGKSKLEAKSKQNLPYLDNQFYNDGCSTVPSVALRRAIFKWKKGFANLSLGLY